LAQSGIGLSLARLANASESLVMLRLVGDDAATAWLERYLELRGCRKERVLLLLGFTGATAQVKAMRAQAATMLSRHAAVSTGAILGNKWRKTRFRSAYLRNALWSAGYAVDTIETAVDWPRVSIVMGAMEDAGRRALATFGEKCHTQTHLSHVYAQGSSVYSTFVFRIAADFEECLARWRSLKAAVSQAILGGGGTISHQHGVGKDHAPYMAFEKGERGVAAIKAMIDHFDPEGLLASGNLLPGRGS
jgi:alkyldihydroxyacetonephosphate synthase